MNRFPGTPGSALLQGPLKLPPGYHGYSIALSPYGTKNFVIASAANYGIVGNGRVIVGAVPPTFARAQTELRDFPTQDAAYDARWSELHEHRVVSVHGDGSAAFWDLARPSQDPIQSWPAHTREIFSVDWCSSDKSVFVTAGWDSAIRVWQNDLTQAVTQQNLSPERLEPICIYKAVWSPHRPGTLVAGSSDHFVTLWDTRGRPMQRWPAHHHHVLSVDWDKYMQDVFYSASADGSLATWDIRNPQVPLKVIEKAHSHPTRCVRASPHAPGIVATSGYDMAVRVWNTNSNNQMPIWENTKHHTEFVFGLDWALDTPGVLASCGWDGLVWMHSIPL
jgi:peroxin-7